MSEKHKRAYIGVYFFESSNNFFIKYDHLRDTEIAIELSFEL